MIASLYVHTGGVYFREASRVMNGDAIRETALAAGENKCQRFDGIEQPSPSTQSQSDG